ncbi:SPOR domain-containing protein [Aquisalinus flavus]|uniref:SPOR domain-containing protein n=1 Tax=Aquisalinus flavus TaxID=1526572 RepID=A0A8J2V4Y7_9PROT|nr:SPOR domain-containing protein [Aquisalinus flavus]MBD0427268.1 SPOR domain-containing protein [Aquisalinus flavus]UNE47082.1 hypothetical protein FF099_02905 [Aquisalinus flavus]GGC99650.1 hypothetical protein GCM10011342_05830 [Aquisalinus flavus]
MAAMSEEYSEEYDEYYDDEEGAGPSGLLILVVGLLIVLVFCLIVVFAYKRGMAVGEQRSGEVPLVTAEAGPVKTERALDLPAGTRPEVEETLSGNPPAEVLVDAGADRDPLENYGETVSASQQVSGSETAPEQETSDSSAQPSTSASTGQATATSPVRSDPDPVATQPIEQPATRPEPAASTPATTPATTPAPTPATTTTAPVSGSHVVQVGAFGSDAEANTFYDRLTGRHATLMSGKRPDIQVADLGDRGVFHRLRIGPFTSYDGASNWCDQLKAAGQDCLVRAVD